MLPTDVLVMDNASIHNKGASIDVIKALLRMHVVFLPAYRPELNAAEYAFRDIKKVLTQRREYGEYTSTTSLQAVLLKIVNKKGKTYQEQAFKHLSEGRSCACDKQKEESK